MERTKKYYIVDENENHFNDLAEKVRASVKDKLVNDIFEEFGYWRYAVVNCRHSITLFSEMPKCRNIGNGWTEWLSGGHPCVVVEPDIEWRGDYAAMVVVVQDIFAEFYQHAADTLSV
jgi:hypothetical protein